MAGSRVGCGPGVLGMTLDEMPSYGLYSTGNNSGRFKWGFVVRGRFLTFLSVWGGVRLPTFGPGVFLGIFGPLGQLLIICF